METINVDQKIIFPKVASRKFLKGKMKDTPLVFSSLILLFGLAMATLPTPALAQRVATISSDGTIRLLQDPHCIGDDCRWIDIDRNVRSKELAATRDDIYQLHTTGRIWRWEKLPCADGICASWTQIDGNPQTIAIAAGFDKLFQLHRNGSIWRFTGSDRNASGPHTWRRVDNNPRTRKIVAAGHKLYQLHDNGSIWRWTGGDCDDENCSSWQQLDNNPNTVEIDYSVYRGLFQRHRDGTIWHWGGQLCNNGECNSWSKVDRNPATTDILTAPGNLFQRHQNGTIWKWQGRHCIGENCSSWTKIGELPGLLDIAAGRTDPVYAIGPDGKLSRWNGENCATLTCPNWIEMGQAFTSNGTSRRKVYVFTGSTPDPDNRFVAIPGRPDDKDGDGLPDSWERLQTDIDVQPNRADLIVIPVMRPELVSNPDLQNTLRENLLRAKEFYANLPVCTESGFTGIHMTVESGRTLDSSFSESADPVRSYREAREPGMPPELIGYAHGLLFGTGTGGGGQKSHGDWARLGNNWPTIVHELGHQLGLNHTPVGSATQSPLYTSLMNYDYNYTYAGNSNAIRLSDGRFSSLAIDERNLNEILPFTVEQLNFLTFGPYEFDVQRVDNGSASVDWNRNGLHRERGISADINDGYALSVGPYNHVGYSHGDIAVAASDDKIIVVRTELPGTNSEVYAGYGASPTTPATLRTTTLREREILNNGTIVGSPIVTGSPTALSVSRGVLIAAPSTSGIQLGLFNTESDGRLTGSMRVIRVESNRELVLVKTDTGAELILWDPQTKHLTTRPVIFNPQPTLGEERAIVKNDGTPLISAGPPGATFNTRTDRIIILTSESDGRFPDRLKLRSIQNDGEYFVAEHGRWLANETARSLDRSAIVFDGSARAGGEGRYLVYYREIQSQEPEGSHRILFVRSTMPQTTGSGPEDPYVFRQRMVINEWTLTQSAPSVVPYQGDYALAWRIHAGFSDPAARNMTEVNLMASGEFASGPADQDDITHIAQRGLRNIEAIRQ